jgi:SpoVK/Ycf46/Vps4 family AAA+-type ATPase
MASSEQIQELIRAHFDGDQARFRTIALQVASTEARSGHRLVAGRIRDLLEKAGSEQGDAKVPEGPTPLARPSRDLRAVLAATYPKERLTDIVLSPEPTRMMTRLLEEQRSQDVLRHSGLEPRRKMLLFGPPGCGKTLAASAIAGELGLPMLRVRVETLFSRYLGETAAMMTAVFDEMTRVRGVYLFDEFDAIGRQRAESNDVGEAKRIVSTFLQLVDADESSSLIIAATNAHSVLDQAMFRRFDDVAEFPLPDVTDIEKLLSMRTRGQRVPAGTLRSLAASAEGLSFADVARATDEALKRTVLDGRKRLSRADLRTALDEVLVARS